MEHTDPSQKPGNQSMSPVWVTGPKELERFSAAYQDVYKQKAGISSRARTQTSELTQESGFMNTNQGLTADPNTCHKILLDSVFLFP